MEFELERESEIGLNEYKVVKIDEIDKTRNWLQWNSIWINTNDFKLDFTACFSPRRGQVVNLNKYLCKWTTLSINSICFEYVQFLPFDSILSHL